MDAEPFPFTITQIGLDALVDAHNGETESIRISEVGLSDQAVAVTPTLDALPGEFKRIATVSGVAADETTIHMTATDYSQDVYDVRSVGLFLADGTLFAAYSHAPGPLFRKVDIAQALIMFDIVFGEAVGGDIEFGDASFLYPPATEVTKGVAELATQAEVGNGVDDARIVTPLKLKTLLDPLLAAIDQAIAQEVDARTDADAQEAAARADADEQLGVDIAAEAAARTAADNTEKTARQNADQALQALVDALRALTITGGGLVSGGGALTASRQLTVQAATIAEALAGTRSDVALTPSSLGGFKSNFSQTDSIRLPGGLILQWGRFSAGANGSTTVTFPLAFPTACCSVVAGGTTVLDEASQDNPPVVVTSTITQTQFAVFASDNEASGCAYIAVGF